MISVRKILNNSTLQPRGGKDVRSNHSSKASLRGHRLEINMDSTAESSDSPDAPEASGRLPIHILSPSSGIPSHMNFHLPMSATVGDLKLVIHNTAPTKPLPDRQRLIYRGRPLIRDQEKLEDILGNLAVGTTRKMGIWLANAR